MFPLALILLLPPFQLLLPQKHRASILHVCPQSNAEPRLLLRTPPAALHHLLHLLQHTVYLIVFPEIMTTLCRSIR